MSLEPAGCVFQHSARSVFLSLRHAPRSIRLVVACAIGAVAGAKPMASGRPVAPYFDVQDARPSNRPSTSAVAVISPSKSLNVSIEPAAGSPALQLRWGSGAPDMMHARLTNHSDRAVLALDVSAFRGSERVLSDRRRAARNEPLVLPGDEYLIDLPMPLDRFVVTSVLWDDGRVEGDPGLLADERVLDLGKAAQIRRVMKLLRDYRDLGARQSLDELRGALMTLPVTEAATPNGAQAGMQQVKEAVLQDLMAFERGQSSPNAGTWRRWLDQTIGAYEDWFARIAAR
jgi:hypothetical protein